MVKFQSKIPDIGVDISIAQFNILEGVASYKIKGHCLNAILGEGLSEDSYEHIAKELRILYSFCFEHVYSEEYEIITGRLHCMDGGSDERKAHLLAEGSHASKEFRGMCTQLLADISSLQLRKTKLRSFFNSAFIWSRANELQELGLSAEAFTQYWRLLDLINAKAQLSEQRLVSLICEHGLPDTQSNKFAVRVLHKMGLLESSKKTLVEVFSEMASHRHPHAHQASDRTFYYMEEETHLGVIMNATHIADITKLFIIWELGLRDYYLKPRGNIYELAKKMPEAPTA